jgi:type III secretion protein D
MLGMAHVAAAPRPVAPVEPLQLAEQLKASEFAALRVNRLPDGRQLVSGRLSTLAQRARLDAWLAARRLGTVRLDVQVDEALARQVTEVFRVNGVAAQVIATAPGRLVAEAAEPDRARLAHAEEAVRRDVHGFDDLSVRNTAPPPTAPAAPVRLADDPDKRIESLVPGDPAYVVTADGSHYFVGSMLPSGHRITQVQAHQLTLERDGQITTLNF